VKKLIAFILVLLVLASMLALPAMASEIQPRYPIRLCPSCGNEAEYNGMYNGYYKYVCDNCRIDFLVRA